MNESLITALRESNPWWSGGFFNVSIKPREAYREIERYWTKKQAIGVFGLRRTGKSFLAFHLIQKLLKTEAPHSILYFSFDNFGKTDLSEVLREAEAVSGMKIRFVFLDEVQKLDQWAEQVKRVYDFKNVKLFLSGSESLFLKKTSKESLGGRLLEYEMKPLSFSEYLSFRGIPRDVLHEPEIKTALPHYLLTGGFPELVEETDAFFILKYFKEAIIDNAIFREIPSRFKLDDPSILEKLLHIITDNPGLLVDKNELARNLGIFRTTVSKYLFYLETCFLVKSLHNYSANASTSERKLKKYYPGFLTLGIGAKDDSAYLGKVVETACVLKSGAKHFWRSAQHDEVDLVLTDPLLPIEVKYRESFGNRDLHGLEKFRKKFRSSSGLVITKGVEKRDGDLRYVPFWKWLLADRL